MKNLMRVMPPLRSDQALLILSFPADDESCKTISRVFTTERQTGSLEIKTCLPGDDPRVRTILDEQVKKRRWGVAVKCGLCRRKIRKSFKNFTVILKKNNNT